MAKVIIKFPYALKQDIRKQKYEELEKQWESGLMVIDDCTQVMILKDEDELVLSENDDQQAPNDCNNVELDTDDEWSVSINNERTKITCPGCSYGRTFRYDDGRSSHWVILPQYCECCGKKMKNGGTKA